MTTPEITPSRLHALADDAEVWGEGCREYAQGLRAAAIELEAALALLKRAHDAINNAMLNPVHGIVDRVLYTRIAMSKPHYESARALAAEIAEALKEKDNG
jgi:hypothetical protein